MERWRKVSQYLFALVSNSYWLFFWKSPIYQGRLKGICVPGLNCYSCPASVMACPLGSLQTALATVRESLGAGRAHIGMYVLGSIGVVGSLAGRLPCGWLCPFGLIQELVFKVSKKKVPLWRPLRYLPYFFLLVFVIILPLAVVDSMGYGQTWFCKYICPAGTLEAGIPLLILQPELRHLAGWLLANKILVLLVILTWCAVTFRPFCRVVCPLGAMWGALNRFSWLRLRFRPDRCVQCKACFSVCPTAVSFYNDEDDINCGACIRCFRCYKVCPAGAVCVEFGPVRRSPLTVIHCTEPKARWEKS